MSQHSKTVWVIEITKNPLGLEEGGVLGLEEGGVLGLEEGGVLGLEEGGVLGLEEATKNHHVPLE